MVGMTGFEPAAFASRTQRSTKLSHIPLYTIYPNPKTGLSSDSGKNRGINPCRTIYYPQNRHRVKFLRFFLYRALNYKRKNFYCIHILFLI